MTPRPVLDHYIDLSTPDSFQFIFHCERCGVGVRSEKYAFNAEGFEQPLAEKARALLWTRQHARAYERASGEARYEFNVCPACERRVCDGCFHLAETSGVCADCKREASKTGSTGRLFYA